MFHLVDRVPETSVPNAPGLLYRSVIRYGRISGGVAVIAFGALCYFKATPHNVGIAIALGAGAVGMLFVAWGGIYCEALFRRSEQVLEVSWKFLGFRLFAYARGYDSLEVTVSWISEIWSDDDGGRMGKTKPWLAVKAGGSTFLFERPASVTVTEKDIPVLQRELGFRDSTPGE